MFTDCKNENLDSCCGRSKIFFSFPKRPEHCVELTRSSLSVVEIKNAWSFACGCLMCLRTRCLIKHLCSFTFSQPDKLTSTDWYQERYENPALWCWRLSWGKRAWQLSWGVRCSGMLRSVGWWLVTDVSVQRIDPVFKGQAVFLFWVLSNGRLLWTR